MRREDLTALVRVIALGFFIVFISVHLITSGQGTLPPCQTPPYFPDRLQNSWPQGAVVTVIIDQNFSPLQQQAVENGFDNWLHNGHGVTFTFQPGTVPNSITRPPANTVYVFADPVNRADNTNFSGSSGRVEGAYMRLGICTTPNNLVGKTAHETGHQFGLANCDGCPVGSSIMAPAYQGPGGDTCNAYYPAGMNGPRECDINAVLNSGAYDPPPPTPTPTPTPCAQDGQSCFWHGDCCSYVCGEISGTCISCEPDPHTGGCASEACRNCYQQGGTHCSGDGGNCWTPILIDVQGNGFDLTDAANGINFDDGSGALIRTAWTAPNSDDAWLALDRNGNGTIDNATELFGSAAPQPAPPPGEIKHGFFALAEYDKWAKGGNLDGKIDQRDAVFPSLHLWQDANHNGVSEPQELHGLTALGVAMIELDYRESRRRDKHGNLFRYRAKVSDERGAQVGRWAWDVFLQVAR